MKIAISLPQEALERIDSAAARMDLNRSEFFRTAGLRFAVEVEASALTHRIDSHLEHERSVAGAEDRERDEGLARLARAAALGDGEDW